MSDEAAPSNAFSFGQPSTFRHGSMLQKELLLQIADSEFSLAHLKQGDQDLLKEALRTSAIEVHDSCVVKVVTEGHLAAFFRKHDVRERRQFDPKLGMLVDEMRDDSVTKWEKMTGEYTEYPYPLGEEQLIPRIIPINLSTVRVLTRNSANISFTARPSALLFEKMAPEDRILNEKQMVIEFDVDPTLRRLTNLNLMLDRGVRVYFGVRISEFKVEYTFENHTGLNRNVLKRVHHRMNGRIGWVFRPKFDFTSELTYGDCLGELKDRSYLFAAIEAIRGLE